MKTVTFWVVREVDTDRFLTHHSNGTYGDLRSPDEAPPRLFRQKRHATCAMRAWVNGPWDYDVDYGWQSRSRTLGPNPARASRQLAVQPIAFNLSTGIAYVYLAT